MKITACFQWKIMHYLEHTLVGFLILAVHRHGVVFIICELWRTDGNAMTISNAK